LTIRIPRVKGVYLLLLKLNDSVNVRTRSRLFKIPKGFYVYIGSAMNRGGLYSRLKRYVLKKSKCFWHIDYLLRDPGVELIGFMYKTVSGNSFDWETYLAKLLGDRFEYINGFGCSDKRWNRSHLYRCGYFLEECLEKIFFLLEMSFEYISIDQLIYKPL